MPRARRRLLVGALASLPLVGLLGVVAACGPSLSSLARDTFFIGYDCPKSGITVTGGGSNLPYQAAGCGKRASYHCHSENGGMGCEEIGRPPPLAAASAAMTAPSATAAPSAASSAP
jgi:hypothetical protein